MKIRKNHIHLFILLFAVSSLLVHSPSDFEAVAATNSDGAIKSSEEINSSTDNGPTIEDGAPPGNPGDQFGNSVADMGDLNGDGVTDLVVGAWTDDDGCASSNCGAIHILYMDTDGSLAASTDEFDCSHAKIKCGAFDSFGKSVAPIDLNNDGVNDIAVGAHKDNCSADSGCAGWDDRGVIHILFMDSDENVTSVEEIDGRVSNGPSLVNNSFFGWSVANIGDYDGDGVDDLVAGGYRDGPGSSQGAIFIMFMNTDGSLDKTIEINSGTTNGPDLSNNDNFGWSVANIGDLNGDGVTDLAVGARGDDTVHILFMNSCNQCAANAAVSSVVEINSTTLGVTVGGTFGDSVASMGDLDGDTVQDLVIGSRTDTGGGSVRIVYMNTDGSPKSSVLIDSTSTNGPTISANDWFGNAVANIGDLDGDGITDMAVGAELDDHGGKNRGALHIIFLLETATATITTSSDGKRNLNPYLTDEILVSVGPNKAIVTDTDYLPNIQIQKGDSIIITLNVADEGPVLDTNTFFGRSDIESVSLYTNFGPRPNGMNLYYANHFNSDGEVSKTFYEWNANKDNVVYDFTKSVEWDNPVVRTAQFDISTDNSSTPAEDKLTITFDSTWNELMPKSEIIVKVVDSDMGYSTTTLPFTLQVGEYNQSYEDLFGTSTDYRFVPLVSDIKVRESIEQWVDPLSGMTDERFVSSLGLDGDELPGYVKHLAQWVVEDKIDLADLIIAVEYIINVK